MPQRITYALQFHRPAGAAGAADAPAVAGGLRISTALGGGTIHPKLEAIAGEEATLAVEFSLNHDETLFFESGTVVFGPPGSSSLAFSSVGTGSLLGAPDSDGFSHGVVAWEIESGTGALAGASGAITSNFLVNVGSGELLDNHLGLIRLPDGSAA